MKIAKELKALQKTWRKSKERNIQEPVPDAKYSVRIVDCRLDKSKSSQRLQVVWVMQIMKGKFKGRMLYKYAGIETANNLGFLKSDLKRLNVKVPKNILRLPKVLDKTIDKEVNITVQTRGEFTNHWFNKEIEDDNEDEDMDTEEEDLEDDDDADEDEDED